MRTSNGDEEFARKLHEAGGAVLADEDEYGGRRAHDNDKDDMLDHEEPPYIFFKIACA
jgi:hypothetical protein